MIIKAAKKIINSDKMCRSYNDLNFGVTFLEHSVYLSTFNLGTSTLYVEIFHVSQILLQADQ